MTEQEPKPTMGAEETPEKAPGKAPKKAAPKGSSESSSEKGSSGKKRARKQAPGTESNPPKKPGGKKPGPSEPEGPSWSHPMVLFFGALIFGSYFYALMIALGGWGYEGYYDHYRYRSPWVMSATELRHQPSLRTGSLSGPNQRGGGPGSGK